MKAPPPAPVGKARPDASFTADSTINLLLAHVQDTPTPPSERTELPIPDAPERLILDCLAKDPAHRPRSAAELDDRLRSSVDPAGWDGAMAREWWGRHLPPGEMDAQTERVS